MADIYSMADTWNNGATTFDAIKMDVTDTASGAASRLLNLLVGGVSKFSVGKGGKLTIPSALNENAAALTQSLSAANAQSVLDLAATWNTSGTPTALKVNVTDTASNAASMLLDLQVGGSSKFSVNKIGVVTAAGSIALPAGNLRLQSNSSVFSIGSSNDVVLQRDAANTLAQRNGTSAQTYNQYFSYTDASNYTRMAFKTATGVHTIVTESAGTGEANIDLALVPKGTGAVRFGTHAAIGAETVTGYITIKDAGGTSRKVAVVS